MSATSTAKGTGESAESTGKVVVDKRGSVWTINTDPDSGDNYYVESTSGKSTWDPPETKPEGPKTILHHNPHLSAKRILEDVLCEVSGQGDESRMEEVLLGTRRKRRWWCRTHP